MIMQYHICAITELFYHLNIDIFYFYDFISMSYV